MSFFESTAGYAQTSRPPHIFVTASPSTYPHLEHCHVIWAVQRLAEIAFGARAYMEMNSNIVLKGRNDYTILGSMSVRNSATAGEGGTGGTTSLNLSAPGLLGIGDASSDSDLLGSLSADPLDLKSNGTVLSVGNSRTENSADMRIDVAFRIDGEKLDSVQIFLTIIRSLARLAVFDYMDMVASWEYMDSAMGIAISMSSEPEKSLQIKYGDVSEALHFVVATMISSKRFAEIGGVFFKLDGPRVDYGALTVRKYRPPASSAIASS